MATQTSKTVIRRGAFDDAAAVAQQVAAGLKFGEVAVDPANLGAGAAAETAVALPSGTALAGALVFVQPPFDLEAGLVCLGARISADDTLSVRLYNPTAGAVDGASKTWTWFVVAIPRLVTAA